MNLYQNNAGGKEHTLYLPANRGRTSASGVGQCFSNRLTALRIDRVSSYDVDWFGGTFASNLSSETFDPTLSSWLLSKSMSVLPSFAASSILRFGKKARAKEDRGNRSFFEG